MDTASVNDMSAFFTISLKIYVSINSNNNNKIISFKETVKKALKKWLTSLALDIPGATLHDDGGGGRQVFFFGYSNFTYKFI